MQIRAYLNLLLMLLTATLAHAEEAALDTIKQALRRPQIQLFIENDEFAGSDRYYTNGFKVGGGAELPLVGDVLQLIPQGLIRVLDQEGPAGEAPVNHVGFVFGQNLYTPRDIGIAENQPFDRPWAAWLYVGSVVQRVRGDRLDTVELDIGVVGPAALGRQVQTGWHALIGAARPKGWSNQISNELAFMAAYLQKRRYGGDYLQIVPHAGLTVGTVLTLARAGGIVRFGQRMSGFGPDTIDPGGAMLQPTRDQDQPAAQTCCEWYGFVGADYRLVARNIFLDGPAFRDGPNVNHRNRVHDLSAGLVFRYQQFNFSLTRIRRSEEFSTAQGGGGRQSFYSLNVGWQFD